jgi:ribose transport system permease protein/AI-2 transport system permease protein
MRAMRPSAILRFGATREATLLAACLLAAIAFAVASPAFATTENLLTILRNSNELLLVSLGMTLLLAMGGVDVSVGMTMGLGAIAVGEALEAGWPLWAAALVGPASGAALGLVSASVVVLGRIPPIVGTLGLLGIYRTAIFLALGGSWLSGLPAGLTTAVSIRPLGIPVALIVILAAYGLVWTALRRTPYGPHLLSVGNSEERARLSGVAVVRTRFATFVVNGVLCGVAAVFYVATYRNVATTIGGALALEAIAAVVLGGTSVTGGRCSLIGSAIGVLLLRLLQNGLLLTGVPSLWQSVATGALLIGVLGLEAAQGRFALARIGAASRARP